MADDTAEDTRLVNIPAKRLAKLEQLELEAELKSSLLAWAKARFWWVTLVITVVGVLGGSALIKTSITTSVDAKTDTLVNPLVIKANEAVAEAKHAESTLRASTQRIGELELRLTEQIKEFEERLVELRAATAELQRGELAGSVNVRSESAQLEARINYLEALVKGVGAPSKPPDGVDVSFSDNAKYGVTILATSGNKLAASRIVANLAQLGFRASQNDLDSYVRQVNQVINSPIQQDVSDLVAELEAIPKRNTLRNDRKVPAAILQRITEELEKTNVTFNEEIAGTSRKSDSADVTIFLVQ